MACKEPPEGYVNIPTAAKMAGVAAQTMYRIVAIEGRENVGVSILKIPIGHTSYNNPALPLVVWRALSVQSFLE